MINCKLLAKGLLMTILIIFWGCASTSRLRTDEEIYSLPYPDYCPDCHDYWYRIYPDDFWYYDYLYPYYPYYYWLDYLEDNNSHPLKEKWYQINKRIKDYREAWREVREEREKRRKHIRQMWREQRREMRERRREIRHKWRNMRRERMNRVRSLSRSARRR